MSGMAIGDKEKKNKKKMEKKQTKILKEIKRDTFVPPCVPYQRTIEHADGTIEIIMYD